MSQCKLIASLGIAAILLKPLTNYETTKTKSTSPNSLYIYIQHRCTARYGEYTLHIVQMIFLLSTHGGRYQTEQLFFLSTQLHHKLGNTDCGLILRVSRKNTDQTCFLFVLFIWWLPTELALIV